MRGLGQFEVSDVVIVATQGRGWSLACRLAERGWRVVVLEIDSRPRRSSGPELEAIDRLGPFVSWVSDAASSEVDAYAALWLPDGPVSLGGPTTAQGFRRLSDEYGVDWPEVHRLAEGQRGSDLAAAWPLALARDIGSAKFAQRQFWLQQSEDCFALPLAEPLSVRQRGDEAARFEATQRDRLLKRGGRWREVARIKQVRTAQGHVDLVEAEVVTGVETRVESVIERSRSVVWMLSEEESMREEFCVDPSQVADFLAVGSVRPELGWWRNRLSLRDLGDGQNFVRPYLPALIFMISTIERPWTHENLMVLERVEQTAGHFVFDLWMRIPFWSRADHVYRDELRRRAGDLLRDRLPRVELEWITPSPLSLNDPAIRFSCPVYAADSVPAQPKAGNLVFAGPETWRGVGMIGARDAESDWIAKLELLRRDWDRQAGKQREEKQI